MYLFFYFKNPRLRFFKKIKFFCIFPVKLADKDRLPVLVWLFSFFFKKFFFQVRFLKKFSLTTSHLWFFKDDFLNFPNLFTFFFTNFSFLFLDFSRKFSLAYKFMQLFLVWEAPSFKVFHILFYFSFFNLFLENFLRRFFKTFRGPLFFNFFFVNFFSLLTIDFFKKFYRWATFFLQNFTLFLASKSVFSFFQLLLFRFFYENKNIVFMKKFFYFFFQKRKAIFFLFNSFFFLFFFFWLYHSCSLRVRYFVSKLAFSDLFLAFRRLCYADIYLNYFHF